MKVAYLEGDSPWEYRDFLIHIHISDLHFGKIDAETQYLILKEQFINVCYELPNIDIISIDGDLFDKRNMSNSKNVMYAVMFVADLEKLAESKNATIIMCDGTFSHDFDQLRMFHHYEINSNIEFYIVDRPKFIETKRARILVIPECAGIEDSEYENLFYYSGEYDACFFHGTVEGAGNPSSNCRLFKESDFKNCKGPCIGGHIHTGGNYLNHVYYCGTPYPMIYGEEEPKGFLICIQNRFTNQYMVYKQEIESFRYRTINLDEMVMRDPKDIINYIDQYKAEYNIDHFRIIFTKDIPKETKIILSNNYRNNNRYVDLEFRYDGEKNTIIQKSIDESNQKIEKYRYLFDQSMSPFEKLATWINQHEEKVIVTGDQIKDFYYNEMKKI